MAWTTFVNGTTADADEVNVNFDFAYYQGGNGTTLNHKSVNMADTEVLILAANSSRITLLIKNNGSNIVYIGATGLADTDGYPIEAGQSVLLYNQEAVYGICSSGLTSDIRILEAE